jgi:hypothetical protein
MNLFNQLISGLKSSLAGPTGSLQNTTLAQQNPVLEQQVSHENPEHPAIATALAAPVPAPTSPAPTTASTAAPTSTAPTAASTAAPSATLSPEEEAVNRIQSQVLNGDFNMANFLNLFTTQFPEAVEGLFKQGLEPLLNSSVPVASETTLAPNQTAPTLAANTTLPTLAANTTPPPLAAYTTPPTLVA